MGGKSGTTTQSVQIPKEVLARYNAVNSQAQSVAATPFQKYSTNPNDFVAGMNQQQYGGIGQINQAANMAQPSIAYAQQGLTGQGYQKGVQEYMNPYLQNAMGATAAQMNNVNQQQQNQLSGNAISSGAFGGDRAGIARNNLINQQNLAMGQTLGQMANQGYQQSAQNYMQGMNSIGQLGLQGQQAALQGGQAMLGAGTLEQQTQQAGQTALYNQFLQQQAYPFQVAQFLANIAMGTGGLSGSTTTTTQPMPFFSDRRLKKNVERIGQTDEGLPIHKFEYKGDPKGQKHIGLMADEVEQVHPEAVGTHKSGYKVVDYDRATSEGGAVTPQRAGLGFASGGDVAAALNAMNASQANMPVMGGGVNAGLAAAAEAIAPRPNVPQSAFYEPSYNPFADPKYQPDLNGTNTSGSGSSNNNGNGDGTGNRNGHDDHRRYQGAYGDRRGDSSPYSNPFNDSSYSADSNGMLHGRDMGFVDGYDPTQGPAYAAGGRAGYQTAGSVMATPYDPMRDPNSIESIIARQMAMYAKNEGGHHVPVGRSLSTGMGKYGRLPEANLPVRSSVMQAGSAPSLPDSMLKQAVSAGSDFSDLFTKGKDVYKYLTKPDEQKAHGGLVGDRHGYSLGSDVPEKDKKETPVDELYSKQNTPTKLDILANMDRSKLSEAGKPPTPTSQTGLSLGEAASLGKTLGSFIMPFFLKDGGRAGYDVGGALTEEEIMKRAAYDPTMLGTKFRGKVDPTAEFMRLSNLKQTATDTPDIYSREAQPANAPRLRYFQERMNRRGHEDVQPTDIYRSAEESAGLDLTMPAGAPRAKPYHSGHNYGFSGDFSGINEKSLADAREVAAQAGLTLGADFKNPDYPHVQGGKGSYGGLYNKYGEKIDMPPGFLQESHSGDVPASATEAAYANARLPNGRGVSGAPSSEGAEKSSSSILDTIFGSKPSRGPDSDRTNSTDMLLSILSGVGSMASSNSPYLGAAILQGIGGGAKTYAGLRNQQSEMALRESEMLKNTMGLLNERFQPLPDGKGFYDVWTGQDASPEKRAAMGIQMGLPPSFFGMGETSGLNGVQKDGSATSSGQPKAGSDQPQAGLNVKTTGAGTTKAGLGSARDEKLIADLPQTRPLPEPAVANAPVSTQPDSAPVVQTNTTAPAVEAPVVSEAEEAYQKKIKLLQQQARDIYASVDQDPRVKPYLDKIKMHESKIADLNATLSQRRAIPLFEAERNNIVSQIGTETNALNESLKVYNDLRKNFADPLLKPINEELTRLSASSPSVTAAEAAKENTLAQQKQNMEIKKEAGVLFNNYTPTKEALHSLIDVYTKFDMNRLSETGADIVGYIKSIPKAQEFLENYGLNIEDPGFQAATDEAKKNAISQAFAQLKEGITDSRLQESIGTVADPSRAAKARYVLITKQSAQLDYDKKKYEDFLRRGDQNQSWADFQADWGKNPENDIKKFQQNAVNDTPYFAGMTLQEIGQLPYKNQNLMRSNRSLVINGKTYPEGQLIQDVKTGVIWDEATGKPIKGPNK